jgi:D-3-phosphoglycerate dehydrogenase
LEGLDATVAKIGEALNATWCGFCDTDAGKGPGAIRMGFEEILKWADIISIHIPFKPGAGCLIGKKDIYMMKKGAWIVNVSRGGVVDETALYNSLKDGHLNGAAIDVFEKEPYSGPLKELKNVVLTPHVGSYAVEARTGMEIEAVENVITGLGI